jgi:hypothetical protein
MPGLRLENFPSYSTSNIDGLVRNLRIPFPVNPAKAGIWNRLNPAFGGTGFRVALRPEHHAVQGFACPE